MLKVGCALRTAHCATDLQHLYRIYSIPTHDKHQLLLLQFIVLLMMDAKGVRNMQSILVVVNKPNTARVASCWFITYYRLNKLLTYLYPVHVLLSNTNLYYPKYSAAGLVLLQIHHQACIQESKDNINNCNISNKNLKLLDRLKILELHTLQFLLLSL